MMTADTVSGPSATIASTQLAGAALHQLLVGPLARGRGTGTAARSWRSPARAGPRTARPCAAARRRRRCRWCRRGSRPRARSPCAWSACPTRASSGGPSAWRARWLLGAADREERILEIARRQRGELRRQPRRRPVRELPRRRIVGQAHRLLGDRLGDLARRPWPTLTTARPAKPSSSFLPRSVHTHTPSARSITSSSSASQAWS